MKRRDFDRACLRQIAGLKSDCNLPGYFAIERPPRGDGSVQAVNAAMERKVTEAACDYLADRMAALEHAAGAGTDTEVPDPEDGRDVPIRVRVAIPDASRPDGYHRGEHDIIGRMLSDPRRGVGLTFSVNAIPFHDQDWAEAAVTTLVNAISDEKAASGVRTYQPTFYEDYPAHERPAEQAEVAWAVRGSQDQHAMLDLEWPPGDLPEPDNAEPETPGPR